MSAKNKIQRLVVVRSPGRIAPRVMDDIAEALRCLGHEVWMLDLAAEGALEARTQAEALACANRLAAVLRGFQPDLAMSYAFGGLIELGGDDGAPTHLFEVLRIPYVCLFYDTPFGLEAPLRRFGPSGLASFVCWDRSYLPWLRALGVRRLLYQPLGTNARVFGHAPPAASCCSTCFVGSINPELATTPMPGSPALNEAARRFVELRLAEPCKDVEALLSKVAAELPQNHQENFAAFLRSPQSYRFRHDLLARSDAAYRKAGVAKAGLTGGIRVFGDKAWEGLNLQGVTSCGFVGYGTELARLYAGAAINLNFTAGHLREAVNQRVFDAPAAGGFVLTDYRRDLEDLFDPDTEIACFRTLDELGAQLERHNRDAAGRARLAAAARRRVLAHHTWDQRLACLLSWLEEDAAG